MGLSEVRKKENFQCNVDQLKAIVKASEFIRLSLLADGKEPESEVYIRLKKKAELEILRREHAKQFMEGN